MLRKSIISVLFLVFGVEYATSNALGNKNKCSSQSCKDAAELLSKNIDQSKDPCRHFYEFSCGNYLDSLIIPNGADQAGHADTLQQTIASQIKGLLEEKVDSKEPRIFGLAKNYYKSCLDESAGQKNLEGLKKIIKQLGGWPVIEGSEWKEENFDVFEADRKLRKIGYRPNRIFKIYSSLDLSNTSRSSLFIGPPDTLVDLESVQRKTLKHKINEAYYNYMVGVAVLLGAKKETAEVELKKVFLFEKSIHKGISHQPQPPYGNLQSIEDLYKVGDGKYPWLEYINDMTGPIVRFENHSIVNVVSSDFLDKVSDSLNKTEKRTVANYVIWRVIGESVNNLPNEYRDRAYDFNKINSKRQAYPPKLPTWADCMNSVASKDGLAVAVSSMYVRRYFRDETRKQVEPIVQYLADAFRETFNKLDERSNEGNMRRFIAYPDELLNDQKLDEYSRSLKISPDDYFQNFLNLKRFQYEFELSTLDQATSDHIWTFFSDSFIVSAYYHTRVNYFVVLAGILQHPVFNPEWPSYATFGGIGFIAGHEIMHAFDHSGIVNKIPGVLTGWMEDTSKDAYMNRTDCLFRQYSHYVNKKTEGEFDGELSFHENLADNAGLKIAYRAYRNWVNKYGEDPRPAQLQNYTSDQLFFISSMNFFCKKMTWQARRDRLQFDEHAPADIRALGMFSNSEEFARAFNCPVGSSMNPREKCAVWD